tara:strand:- start:125 stop:319 length:195 start_codon:yes stop_codon:yes gene_type:complete
MGSGGSLTLWPPSNEAGAHEGFDRCPCWVDIHFGSGFGEHPALKIILVTNADIDGGTSKREQSN